MGHELWVEAYETKIQELCDEFEMDFDTAEKMIEREMDGDAGYLDDYFRDSLTNIAECYQDKLEERRNESII